MADVSFRIGHKDYTLHAQDGEEKLLMRAAEMLDAEAQSLISQAGRMPEARLLLVAGLMLADRMSSLEDRLDAAERELTRLRAQPGPVASDLKDKMAELAGRAEALAERAEQALDR